MRWSVVIPAYMPGENLAITLESVVAAMGGRHDFEVIVVDDASPDPIDLGDYGPLVRVERHSDNVGAVPNFNRAVGYAQGDFVHVLHADDYVEVGFYEALERGLTAEDSVIAAACGARRVDGAGRLILTMKPEQARPGIWPDAFERLAVANRLPAVSVVAKRSAYEQVGGFDESLAHAADWDMWIRFSKAGDVYYDPTPLASYRVHQAQHTASLVRSGKNIDEAVEVINRLPERAPQAQARRLMTRAFLYRAVYATRTAANAMRAGQVSVARTQFKAGARCALLGAMTFVRR